MSDIYDTASSPISYTDHTTASVIQGSPTRRLQLLAEFDVLRWQMHAMTRPDGGALDIGNALARLDHVAQLASRAGEVLGEIETMDRKHANLR